MKSAAGSHTIGLVVHPSKPVDRSVAAIMAAAPGVGSRLLVREADRGRVPADVEAVPEDRFVAEVDSVITLGGDGTMLGAMRLMADRTVPILGVNHGNLGYLVEVHPDQLPSALTRLEAGDFTIERYPCLDVTVDGAELGTRFGFNDVVLTRSQRTGAVSIDLTVNELRYGYYRADAVVVSTHRLHRLQLRRRGPVLSPSSGAIVLTPVAPMAGIARPVVLGAGDRVTLTVATDSAPIAIEIDGTAAGTLDQGQRLTATVRADAAQVVRLSADEHASRSRVKLSLLDLPLRPDQLVELIPPELRRRAIGDDLNQS